MKKTLLFLFLFPASTLFSQAMINIDSVKTQPANPTATDPVYLHIYGWCGYGCALNGTPTVLTAGMNHTVQACYYVNVLSVITNIHDSIYLFTGPSGVHNVIWGIVQNSDQFTPTCDVPVTNGSESVNVLTTDIPHNVQDQFTISWNAADHSFFYSSADKTVKTLSVYTMNGQLVTKSQLSASAGMVSLGEEASGLFIVVVEDENGVLVREKIYCY
jgi:hypothetical protein